MSKYLDCASAFAETMRDKYIAPDSKDNHLLIIARDSEKTVGGIMGKPSQLAQSLYGVCMEDEDLRRLILNVAKHLIMDAVDCIFNEDEEGVDDDTD